MTEAEWLECTSLKELLSAARPRMTRRMKQLLLVGFARRVQHLMRDRRSLEALQVLEQHLDGQAGIKELRAARAAASAAKINSHSELQKTSGEYKAVASAAGQDGAGDSVLSYIGRPAQPDVLAARSATIMAWATMQAASAAEDAMKANSSPYNLALYLHSALELVAWWSNPEANRDAVKAAEDAVLCSLVRDVVGAPSRPVTISPAWLTRSIGSLAQHIYDEHTFDRLPILADALEEAGCTDTAILSHLRGPGPHVRGCWALDLILGRK